MIILTIISSSIWSHFDKNKNLVLMSHWHFDNKNILRWMGDDDQYSLTNGECSEKVIVAHEKFKITRLTFCTRFWWTETRQLVFGPKYTK